MIVERSAKDDKFCTWCGWPYWRWLGIFAVREGLLALQFLRERVGDPAFFEILRAWTSIHRHSDATTAQFVALAQEISGQDLTQFFHDWIYSTGKPLLFWRPISSSSWAGRSAHLAQ
jgi:hypothetical protein